MNRNREGLYDLLMDFVIDEIDCECLDRNEAECIALAWLLKTKIYMIGETSHKWSKTGVETLRREISKIDIENLKQ